MPKVWWRSARPCICKILPVFLLALVSLGCGKGKGEITGTVTYKNKPLAFGTVTIMDAEGAMHYSQIDADGSYSIKDVATGPAKLIVACVDPNEVEIVNRAAGRGGKRGSHSKGTRPTASQDAPLKSKGSLIPTKYGSFDSSGIIFTVEKDANRYDVDLK